MIHAQFMGRVGLRDVHILARAVQFRGGVAGGVDATCHGVEGIASGTDRKKLVGGVVRMSFDGGVRGGR